MGNCSIVCEDTDLNLINNDLQHIPQSVLNSHTESLDLTGNHIAEIPSEVKKLSNLKFLDLKKNKIARIPPEICSLARLTTLHLDNNSIRTLPDSIGKISTLEVLTISNNHLEQIPSTIGDLTKLSELNVSYNSLRDLPDELQRCKLLTTFKFDHNQPLNLTFLRFVSEEFVRSSILSSFFAYRSKHPLVSRYNIRHDQAVRDYYADHALQQTSWVDPRYYDFVRTLPYEDRIGFNMQGDPTTHALPTTIPSDMQVDAAAAKNNWGCPLFNAYIVCTNSHCPHISRMTTMACPYRLCPNCCKHPTCPYHRAAQNIHRPVGTNSTAASATAACGSTQNPSLRTDTYLSTNADRARGGGVNNNPLTSSQRSLATMPAASVVGANRNTNTGASVRNPAVLLPGNGGLSMAVTFPQRREALKRELQRMHPPEPENYGKKTKLKMFVSRKNLMEDSFRIVMTTRAEFLKLRLWVAFDGEEGVDYGGLTREWYLLLLPAITDPNYGLFMPSPSNSYVYQINPLSSVNPDHLQYFRFTGRILGMALFDNRFVETFFSPVFYKQLLGLPLTLRDMEYYDNEFFRSLLYLRENEGVEELGLYFTITEEEFGVVSERELIPGGASKAVTDRNKEEYIRYMLNYRLCMNTAEQMASIKRGFHDLIPEDLFTKIPFTAPELEMLICGISTIDSADWQRNTEYGGNYGQNSPQIVWFWEIVRNMTNEDRARLLQFVTGTTKLPHGGFAQLVGSTGPRRFQIIRTNRTKDYLPTAHTCFNQLELPEYKTKGELNEKLRKAMDYAQKAFEMM